MLRPHPIGKPICAAREPKRKSPGVTSRELAECDGNAVPCIDGGDDEGNIHDFLFRKMGFQGIVFFVGGMGGGNMGEGFRPVERGAFLIIKQGRLMPCRKLVETGLGFAIFPRFFRMVINAEDAAVNLGNPDFQKVAQLCFDGCGGEIFRDRSEIPERFRSDLIVVEPHGGNITDGSRKGITKLFHVEQSIHRQIAMLRFVHIGNGLEVFTGNMECYKLFAAKEIKNRFVKS